MTDRARIQTIETTGSAGNILRRTESNPAVEWTAEGATTIAYKAADESVTSSTTLQDDDALTLSVVAGARYVIEGRLFINLAGLSGIQIALSGTSTVTALKVEVVIYDDGSGITANGRITSYGSAVDHGAAHSGDHFATINGAVQVNAAGTLLVQWAQKSSVADAATMQIGSTLKLTRIS